MDAFAVAPPGIGAVTLAELAAAVVGNARLVPGGVEFSGGWSEIYRANLLLRSASRVLVRIAEFPAVSFPELERKLKKVRWLDWLADGARVEPHVACTKSKLYHSGKVGKTLLEAAPGSVGGNGMGLGVYLRIHRDVVTVSVDTSGEHLHRRGYRKLAGEAPIRENLAAACLLALGYDGSEPLLDPCCGSGTFAVEAAMIAMRIPPGIDRDFAFRSIPTFDPGLWDEVRGRALEGMRSAPEKAIYASDVAPEAVKLAVASAKAAGVADFVAVAESDVAELEAPEGSGLLVANPPYGIRLGGGVYGKLKRALRGEFRGWRWGIIECGKPGSGRLGIDSAPTLEFSGGGLGLRLIAGNPSQNA